MGVRRRIFGEESPSSGEIGGNLFREIEIRSPLQVHMVAVLTHTDVATDASLTIVYAILAFVTSKNYMHTLGLK